MSGRHTRHGREFPPLDAYGMPPTFRDWWRALWYCLWHDHDRATPTDRCQRCGTADEPLPVSDEREATW